MWEVFLYIDVEMDNFLILGAGNASCQNYALQVEFWNTLLWRIFSEDSKQANKKDYRYWHQRFSYQMGQWDHFTVKSTINQPHPHHKTSSVSCWQILKFEWMATAPQTSEDVLIWETQNQNKRGKKVTWRKKDYGGRKTLTLHLHIYSILKE